MTATVPQHDRQIGIWLLLVCLAIFIMLVLGGATRLTNSGLSMMTWDPLMGWIPPLNEEQWQDSFEHYKKIPEFYELNPDMDLEGYKGIFLLEYVHRAWGRLIGLFFLLPFLYFLVRGYIRRPLVSKFVAMFVLGGLQGVMGWYMVSSGFTSAHVSPYRLTVHLLFAFLIFGYLLWVALGLLLPRPEVALEDVGPLKRAAIGVTALITLVVASGGFVAGLDAGFAYNTFPLMEGRFVPDGYLMLEPWYKNLFDNIAAVQFDHRWLAVTTLLLVAGLWWYARSFPLNRQARLAFHALLAMAAIQVILGITTLLLVVPVTLGVAHQGGAMVLFTLALYACYLLHASERGGR